MRIIEKATRFFTEEDDDFTRRSRLLLFVVIFVLAALVRLAVISRFAVLPVNDLLWNDAAGWNLANGHGFTASQSEPYIPAVFRTPGYPALLAVVYTLFGHSYSAAFVAQAVIDSLSAVLIALIAFELVSPRIAITAGVLYALYPYSAMFCGILHQDILLTSCVLLVLFLTTKAARHRRMVIWTLVGLSLGLTVLVKPLFVMFSLVPIMVVAFSSQRVAQKLLQIAVLGAGLAVVVSPWFLRNYIEFRSFPPLAVGGTGTNMMYLLMELEGGESQLVSSMKVAEYSNESASQYLGEFVDGAALIEREKQIAAKALPELGRRWPQYLLLVFKHIPRLWVTLYAIGRSQMIAIGGLVISVAYLVLGLLGMYSLRQQWRKLLPLYATVVVITMMYAPYTAEARYTLPARPVQIIFVAAAICVAIEKLRNLWPGELKTGCSVAGDA